MKRQFELLEATRNNIMKEIEGCSVEQLFEIPTGFNNHIMWNVVHSIVTQQILLYGSSSTPYVIDGSIIDEYKKGTTPTSDVDTSMVGFVIKNLLSTVTQAKEDYQDKVFGTYEPRTTSYGVTLNTIEDAICFVNLHDSMHYGQIKMLKALLQD